MDDMKELKEAVKWAEYQRRVMTHNDVEREAHKFKYLKIFIDLAEKVLAVKGKGILPKKRNVQYYKDHVITHADEDLGNIQAVAMKIAYNTAIDEMTILQVKNQVSEGELIKILRKQIHGRLVLACAFKDKIEVKTVDGIVIMAAKAMLNLINRKAGIEC